VEVLFSPVRPYPGTSTSRGRSEHGSEVLFKLLFPVNLPGTSANKIICMYSSSVLNLVRGVLSVKKKTLTEMRVRTPSLRGGSHPPASHAMLNF
jgi:hypothetical protein